MVRRVFGILVALTLVGCGGPSGGGTEAPSSATTLSAASCPKDVGGVTELNVITWSGYQDPPVVAAFEECTGIHINATVIGSDDELFAKINAGGIDNYDLLVSSKAYIAIYLEQGSIVAIDESRVPNLANLEDVYRTGTVQPDGVRGAIPYVTGNEPPNYNPAEITEKPTSYSAIFDPSSPYCGKVGWVDSVTEMITFGALYLEMPDPFAMSKAELQQVVDMERAAKSCVKAIAAGNGDNAGAFVAGDVTVALSMGPPTQKNAAAQGLELGYFVPEEGVPYWIDNTMVTPAGMEKKDKAVYAFLNYTLELQTQKAVAEASGWPGVVKGLSAVLSPETVKLFKTGDQDLLDHLVPLQPPSGEATLQDMIDAWNAIKAP